MSSVEATNHTNLFAIYKTVKLHCVIIWITNVGKKSTVKLTVKWTTQLMICDCFLMHAILKDYLLRILMRFSYEAKFVCGIQWCCCVYANTHWQPKYESTRSDFNHCLFSEKAQRPWTGPKHRDTERWRWQPKLDLLYLRVTWFFSDNNEFLRNKQIRKTTCGFHKSRRY